MLHFRSFLPANDKVKQVEFHPVQPWVGVVSKANTVSVWDWNSLKIVQEFQMGGYDDEALMEMNLAKLGEKDPSVGRAPTSLLSNATRQQSGSVKQIKFFDADVAYYQQAGAHYSVLGSTVPVPDSPSIQALSTYRLLVMACENKVVVMDLVSRRCQELHRPALDNKAPTCIAFLLPLPRHAPLLPSSGGASPLLAVGLSDGSVRLVQLSNLKVLAKLAAGHKAALTHLLVVPGGKGAAGDQLVGVDTGGSLVVWEPLSRPMGMAEQQLAPRMSLSAHDKEVTSLCLGYGAEDLEKAHPRVFTAGVDNRVASWDPLLWKEATRVKVDPKTPLAGMAFSGRNLGAIGSHNLTLATATPTLLAMHANTGVSRHVCNLNGVIPAGTKKVPKIYCIATHATQPHMVVVGANTGAAICAYDSVYLPPIAFLPSAAASALVDPLGGAGGPETTLSYICALGSQLASATVAAHVQEVDGRTQASTRVTQKGVAVEVGQAGKAFLSTSHDGQYLAVAWPIARSYVVFWRTATNSWEEVDRGSGVCVAWCSYKARYAVLEEPPPPTLLPEPSRKGLGRKGKGPDPAALRDAMAAASAAAAANTRVRVKELTGKVAKVVVGEMALRIDVPTYLHGGAFLGVVYRRTVSDVGPLADGGTLQVLQFFDWDGVTRLGAELPEPMWMSWDPHHQYCALAYPTQVLLCAVRPSFQPLTSLPITLAQSASWGSRQLFLATPTSVVAIFVLPHLPALVPLAGVPEPDANKPSFQVLTLASVDAVDPPAAESSGAKEGGLPQVVRRPPGPLVVLGAAGGHLWVANTQGHALPISLSHAGMRMRCLAAEGDLEGARLVADMRMHAQHHDGAAALLCALGGRAGAQTALSLSGLTLQTDIEVSVRAGQWERVITGCRALLAGCHYRPPAIQVATTGIMPLSPFPAALPPAPSAIPGQTGIPPMSNAMALQLLAALHGEPLEGAPSAAPTLDVAPSLEELPPANIDWGAPIRQAHTHKARQSLARAPTATTATTSSCISPAAVTFALRVADAALAAGLRDTAARVVALLLEQPALLPPSCMGQVALRVQEVGLQRQLPSLHVRTAAFATSTEESSGLFSAAAAGGAEVLQAALRQGGAVALAALQGANFRLLSAAAEEASWNTHLRAMAGFDNDRGLRFQVSQY